MNTPNGNAGNLAAEAQLSEFAATYVVNRFGKTLTVFRNGANFSRETLHRITFPAAAKVSTRVLDAKLADLGYAGDGWTAARSDYRTNLRTV